MSWPARRGVPWQTPLQAFSTSSVTTAMIGRSNGRADGQFLTAKSCVASVPAFPANSQVVSSPRKDGANGEPTRQKPRLPLKESPHGPAADLSSAHTICFTKPAADRGDGAGLAQPQRQLLASMSHGSVRRAVADWAQSWFRRGGGIGVPEVCCWWGYQRATATALPC